MAKRLNELRWFLLWGLPEDSYSVLDGVQISQWKGSPSPRWKPTLIEFAKSLPPSNQNWLPQSTANFQPLLRHGLPFHQLRNSYFTNFSSFISQNVGQNVDACVYLRVRFAAIFDGFQCSYSDFVNTMICFVLIAEFFQSNKSYGSIFWLYIGILAVTVQLLSWHFCFLLLLSCTNEL